MLRCIAVDDEALALDLLEDNIRQVPFLRLERTCRNGLEATQALEGGNIDLVFTDIQMPGLTGLQWINTLVRKPMVILITAYEKYALQGFDLDVVDYLLKPVAPDRFVRACNRARDRVMPYPAADFFFASVDYSFVKVDFKDIVWVERLKDYIKIYLHHSAKPVITRMGMRAIEELLPPGRFIRVHKSYIVSVDRIHSIRKNSVYLGEREIPVSDFYRGTVQALTRR